jgi:hypothetical protein
VFSDNGVKVALAAGMWKIVKEVNRATND